MLIADSQVHVWSANTPERPWREGVKPHRDIPLDTLQLLKEMNEAGVDRAVLVPSQLEHNRNDLALEASQKHPDRFITMGRMDINSPEAKQAIANWRNQKGLAGIRCSFKEGRWKPVFQARQLEWLWAAAESAALPMMMNTHGMIAEIEDIAQRYPGFKFALDHLALNSKKKDEDAFHDIDELVKLAKYPNIMVKVSALSTYSTDSYPYRNLHPYIRKVYDSFGPKRMFWGTDLSRLNCTYRQAITMWTEEMPWLTTEDKEWIMGRSLCNWLGWPINEIAPSAKLTTSR